MDRISSPVANIILDDETVTIVPRGWHRLASMTRTVAFPLTAIDWTSPASPDRLLEVFRPRMTKRKKGSQIADRYRAGSFQYWKGDDWTWLLVRRGDPAVEFALVGHRFDRVVIAVDDAEAAVRIVKAAKGLAEHS